MIMRMMRSEAPTAVPATMGTKRSLLLSTRTVPVAVDESLIVSRTTCVDPPVAASEVVASDCCVSIVGRSGVGRNITGDISVSFGMLVERMLITGSAKSRFAMSSVKFKLKSLLKFSRLSKFRMESPLSKATLGSM